MKRILSLVMCVVLLASCMVFVNAEETAVSFEDAVNAYIAANAEAYAKEVTETLAYDESLLDNSMGFRQAGSDAEHAAADWIANKMETLGLTEVEKIPVTVDKFQFNDAKLTIEGTEIDIMPASYQQSGTDADGITAEIVDCGTGFAADYEGKDVEGKIVLIGIDQWNECWISGYIAEAHSRGAAAVVSYDVGGYARYDDDQINLQDVCQDDLLPTVSISYNQGMEIAEAIANGNNMCTLMVDTELVPDEGVSYNVAGRIKGKDSSEQIIVSGHYDIYFNGVQDDCAAIGLALGIAKSMIDSGFQPEHDIVFVAHGAEEWGAIGTEFDWTTGAWELINNVRPEWAMSTIAMINFELPAFYAGAESAKISCVPEYANVVAEFVNSAVFPESVNNIYPEGFDSESVDSNTMEDGVSYRFAGVPYFVDIPHFGGETSEDNPSWIEQHYHTQSDDMSTYNADVMATNINTYGVLAMYVDQMAAMPVDFTATCEDIAEAMNPELMTETGVDAEAYAAALDAFTASAENYNTKIAELNESADFEAGRELNKNTHEAFKFVQDNLIGVIASSDIVVRNVGYQANIEILEGVIAALEKGELGNDEGTGALDLAWQLNGSYEYVPYIFSEAVVHNSNDALVEELDEGNFFWGSGKGYKVAETYMATYSLLEKAESGDTDFSEEIAIYAAALEEQKACFAETANAEIEAMNTVAQMLAK